MQKRGVSEVITIVLIVLIAFAAVVIVYNLTTTFLRQKTNTIDIGTLSTEVGINENALYINYTENTTQLTVTRSADSYIDSVFLWYKSPAHSQWVQWGRDPYHSPPSHQHNFQTEFNITSIDGAGQYNFEVISYNRDYYTSYVYASINFSR